jgi:hypothetical protein
MSAFVPLVGAKRTSISVLDAHRFAHAFAVDGHERIARQDAARHIGAEKARGVSRLMP